MLNASAVSTKPRLTEELTTTFIESYNSKHVSGKSLRNKKKPNCLVLDDFCIDYHNTSLDSKVEKKHQYLKPRGAALEINQANEIEVINHSNKQDNSGVPNEGIDNGGVFTSKISKNKYMGTKHDGKQLSENGAVIVFQEASGICEKATQRSQENLNEGRYSKRKRSGKPKRYFDFEFDMNPERKSQNQSKIIESKEKFELVSQKIVNGTELNKSNHSSKEYKGPEKGKRLDKRQEEQNRSSVDSKSLKRSARIKLKRSLSQHAKFLEKKDRDSATIEAKKGKFDGVSKHSISDGEGLKLKSNTILKGDPKTANENGKDVEVKKKKKVMPNKMKNGNEPAMKMFGEMKQLGYKSSLKKGKQRDTVSSKKVSRGSPMKNTQHALSSIAKPENNVMQVEKKGTEITRSGDQEINSDMLLCHEPSFLESFDYKKSMRNRMAVLRRAEMILGGRIKLLERNDVIEFEKMNEKKIIPLRDIDSVSVKKESNEKPVIVLVKQTLDQGTCGEKTKFVLVDFKEAGVDDARKGDGKKSVKIEMTASKLSNVKESNLEMPEQQTLSSAEHVNCANKNKNGEKTKKEKEGPIESRIVIDRSKGTVSIESVLPEEQTKELNSREDQPPENSSSNKGNENVLKKNAVSVFNLLNEKARLLGHEDGKNESDSCIEEVSSSDENNDSIKNCSFEKTKECQYQRQENKGKPVSQHDSSVRDSSKRNDNVKSIYAQMSFQRLLASVQKETAQAKKTDNFPEENEMDDTLTRKFMNQPKQGDLFLKALQKECTERMKQGSESSRSYEHKTDNGADALPCLTNTVLTNELDHNEIEMMCGEFQEGRVLLDALINTKNGKDGYLEGKGKEQSQKSTSHEYDSQLNKRTKMNSFKTKEARNRPSIKCVSGLKNIERKMVNLRKGSDSFMKQNSMLEKIDTSAINVFIKKIHSFNDDKILYKTSKDSFGPAMVADVNATLLDDNQPGLDQNCCVPCEENLKIKKCDGSEGLLCEEKEMNERSKGTEIKGNRPKRHISNVKGNPETDILRDNVKATLLQFNSNESTKGNNHRSQDSICADIEDEAETGGKNDTKLAKGCLHDADTMKTVYSVGKVRKAYRQPKIVLRRYPIPKRSWRNRTRMLGSALHKKTDLEESDTGTNLFSKLSPAREQGEELLKQMFNLNKGIFIT